MSGQAWRPAPEEAPELAQKTRAAGSTGDVDRIRDILPGSHRRAYAQHFREHNQRVPRETTGVATETSETVSDVELVRIVHLEEFPGKSPDRFALADFIEIAEPPSRIPHTGYGEPAQCRNRHLKR